MSHASLRRIYDLDRMIRAGELHNAEEAAARFEVTRRTIERDLDTLRTDLGAELRFNRAEGRYEYTSNPVVTLSGQGLNEREIAIILIAERALRQFTGSSFQDEVHPAFNKLSTLSGTIKRRWSISVTYVPASISTGRLSPSRPQAGIFNRSRSHYGYRRLS